MFKITELSGNLTAVKTEETPGPPKPTLRINAKDKTLGVIGDSIILYDQRGAVKISTMALFALMEPFLPPPPPPQSPPPGPTP